LNIEQKETSDQKLSKMSVGLLILRNIGHLKGLEKAMYVIAEHLTTSAILLNIF